jgi:hypothetical protein
MRVGKSTERNYYAESKTRLKMLHIYQRAIIYLLLLLVGWDWVPRYLFKSLGIYSSPWYCGHFGLLYKPQMIDDDDFWSNWWNENWQGKPKYSEKTYPSATLSTTKSHMTRPGLEPRTAAVGSQRLTAWAMARPFLVPLLQELPFPYYSITTATAITPTNIIPNYSYSCICYRHSQALHRLIRNFQAS